MVDVAGIASAGSEWLVHARVAVRDIDEAGRADLVAGLGLGSPGGRLDGALARATDVTRGIVDDRPAGMLDAVHERLRGATGLAATPVGATMSPFALERRALELRTALALADAASGVRLLDGTVPPAGRAALVDAARAHVVGLVEHADAVLGDGARAASGHWVSQADLPVLAGVRAAGWDAAAAAAMEEASGTSWLVTYSLSAEMPKVLALPQPKAGPALGKLRDLRTAIDTTRRATDMSDRHVPGVVEQRLAANFVLDATSARARLAARDTSTVPALVDELVVAGDDASHIDGQLADGLEHSSDWAGWVERSLSDSDLDALGTRAEDLARRLLGVLDAPGRDPLPELQEARLRIAADTLLGGRGDDWTYDLRAALRDVVTATSHLVSTQPGARDLAADPMLRARTALATATLVRGTTPRDDFARAAALLDGADAMRAPLLDDSISRRPSPARREVDHVTRATAAGLLDVLPRVRARPEVAGQPRLLRGIDRVTSVATRGQPESDTYEWKIVRELQAALHGLAGTEVEAGVRAGSADDRWAASAGTLRDAAATFRASTAAAAAGAGHDALPALLDATHDAVDLAWVASASGPALSLDALDTWRAATDGAIDAAAADVDAVSVRGQTVLTELDDLWRSAPAAGSEPTVVRDWLAAASARTAGLAQLATSDAREHAIAERVDALARAAAPSAEEAVDVTREVLRAVDQLPADAAGVGVLSDALSVLARVLRRDPGDIGRLRVADRLEEASTAMVAKLGDPAGPSYMRRVFVQRIERILWTIDLEFVPRGLRPGAGPVERNLTSLRTQLASSPWLGIGLSTGPNGAWESGTGSLVAARAELAGIVADLRHTLQHPGEELPAELVDWTMPSLERAEAELRRAEAFGADSRNEDSTPRHAVFGALSSTLDMVLDVLGERATAAPAPSTI